MFMLVQLIKQKQFKGTLKLLRKSETVEGVVVKELGKAARKAVEVTVQIVLDTVDWSMFTV